MLRFIFLSLVAVALDLLSKFWATLAFPTFSEKFTIIPNFLNFRLAYNYGFSFSLGSEYPNIVYYLGFLATAVGLLLIYGSYRSFKSRSASKYTWLEGAGMFLIGAGAIGNGVDRLYNTYVIDFIAVNFGNYQFPVFNIADIYITFGVIFYILSSFVKSDETVAQATASSDPNQISEKSSHK